MLSFPIDNKISNRFRELNTKLSIKEQQLRSFEPGKRDAIQQLARVSQVGASTRIENAILTDAEIEWMDTLLSKSGQKTAFINNKDLIENKFSKDRERSIEEVAGCRGMLFLIYEQYKDFLPLRETDIRGLHNELLKYYPKASHYLGRYKIASNSVVARNKLTKEERIVFKTADPGTMTTVAMRDLVDWYNEVLPENPWGIAIASELTLRFLAIHPFQDGNGRLGRGLFLLSLLQSPDRVLSNVSRYLSIDRQIEKHKEEYYYVLQKCSDGIFNEDPKKYNIEYFCNYMVKIIDQAIDDIDYYANRYENIKALPESAYNVLSCFREYPEKRLKIGDLISQLKIPRRTINNSINLLLKARLLQKYGKTVSTRYQIVF